MSETILRDGEPPPDKRAAEREEKQQGDPLAMAGPVAREMSDPQDALAPMPIWLVLSFFFIVGFSGYYLAGNNGGFRADGYAETSGGAPPAEPKKVDLAVVGRQVYNNCSQCHQENGAGIAGVYPPLANSEWVTGRPEVLIRILLHGLNGDVIVRGATYNGNMPAWGHLKDDFIAGVLTHIRSSFGNQAGVIEPQQVAAVRKETEGRTKAWTAEELKSVPEATPSAAPVVSPPK